MGVGVGGSRGVIMEGWKGGKRLNRRGDEDGVAVVMETSRRGNSPFFSRQTGRQAHGG